MAGHSRPLLSGSLLYQRGNLTQVLPADFGSHLIGRTGHQPLARRMRVEWLDMVQQDGSPVVGERRRN